MKHILSMIPLIALLGCSGGGGGSASKSSSVPWNAYYAATTTDLPTCSGDIVGRLYYVEDVNSFSVCKSTGWASININGNDGADGADGADGVTIASIKTISAAASTDYCTQYTGENCYFKGGQLITFSDGSFMIGYNWSYSYIVSGDSDFDTSTGTLFFPASWTSTQIRMNYLVARGSGYKTVYLVYIKSPESVGVWVDTDGSGTVESTDELLYTATLTSL